MPDNSTTGLLASIFGTFREPDSIGAAWREAGARSMDDIAKALEEGVDPRVVAIAARGAAVALRDPKQWSKAKDETQERLLAYARERGRS